MSSQGLGPPKGRPYVNIHGLIGFPLSGFMQFALAESDTMEGSVHALQAQSHLSPQHLPS